MDEEKVLSEVKKSKSNFQLQNQDSLEIHPFIVPPPPSPQHP